MLPCSDSGCKLSIATSNDSNSRSHLTSEQVVVLTWTPSWSRDAGSCTFDLNDMEVHIWSKLKQNSDFSNASGPKGACAPPPPPLQCCGQCLTKLVASKALNTGDWKGECSCAQASGDLQRSHLKYTGSITTNRIAKARHAQELGSPKYEASCPAKQL